jgi:hypothetical protein
MNKHRCGNGVGDSSSYDSRTEPPVRSTARKLGKHYQHGGAVSDNADKRSDRPDDGRVTSKRYAADARARRAAGGDDGRGAAPSRHIHLDYSHPLEAYLAKWWMQRLLGYISAPRPGRKTLFEEIVESYADPDTPTWNRIKYWPLHRFIKRIKGGVSDERFRERVALHRSTVRGFVATARSVAEFGLTLPQ